MSVDLGTMAKRLEAREAGDQRTRAEAVEDLARRLAWGPAADRKAAAEVERLCTSAEEVRALERRVAALRRLRELQPVAARALELRAARREVERRYVAAIAEHNEHGRHAAARLATDRTLSAADVEELRRLACYPDRAPMRQAEAAQEEADRALAQALEIVPADVAQAYHDAAAALVRTEAEPARLQRAIAERTVELPQRTSALRGELANAKDERHRIDQIRRRGEPAPEPSSREPEVIEAELEALPAAVADLKAELAGAPKLIELARKGHEAAFKSVVTWGRA